METNGLKSSIGVSETVCAIIVHCEITVIYFVQQVNLMPKSPQVAETKLDIENNEAFKLVNLGNLMGLQNLLAARNVDFEQTDTEKRTILHRSAIFRKLDLSVKYLNFCMHF